MTLLRVRSDQRREERVGSWRTVWAHDESRSVPEAWKAHRWEAGEETLSVTHGPIFVDVTSHALGGTESYKNQMLRGADYWRTVLDGACGIDVYGNNGVAAGDFDNDGFDDLYVCQPAGLPNRLYRNRGDGTFEDVTEKAGVGVLDNTACALFADFQNNGRQDLLVVCGSGPLLFLNQGMGRSLSSATRSSLQAPPQGTFTHAAIADYDCDGRLDIYFCMYIYYLGLDQYHYPVPYFDARNGPPNCLLHNEGNATFVEKTEAAGLNADNDRYSFACAWGTPLPTDCPIFMWPMISGVNNFIATTGTGRSRAASSKAHVEDVGAGMSAAGPTSITTESRIFTSPICGRPRDRGFRRKSNFRRKRRKTSERSISGMREAMRSIETWGMGSFKTSASKPGSRWAVGPGVPISGTSITTAIPDLTLPMDTSQRRSERNGAIWPVSSGGRWWQSLPRTRLLRLLTSMDGMPSTN